MLATGECLGRAFPSFFNLESAESSLFFVLLSLLTPHTVERIESFLTYLTADKGYSPQTVSKYEQCLLAFRTFFMEKDAGLTWTDIDTDVVRAWVAHRHGQGLHPHTIQQGLSALRSFYRYLMRMNLATRNPATLVRNPKADKPLPTFLKQEEMNRLLDDTPFPDSFEGRRDHLVLLLLYWTGMRCAELVGLNVEDVNLQGGELKVTGKRNKQRILPFGPEVREAIESYLTERAALVADGSDDCRPRSGALLIHRPSRPKTATYRRISPTEVANTVHHYLSLVTTQRKRSPHVLRHTFATVMLNNGADLEAVKELLGHESLETTEIYTHTTFTELQKEYNKAHPRSQRNPHDAQ